MPCGRSLHRSRDPRILRAALQALLRTAEPLGGSAIPIAERNARFRLRRGRAAQCVQHAPALASKLRRDCAMSAELRADAASARAAVSPPRRIRAHERSRLVAWLDDGLRRGQRGRLEAEYPLSLTPRDLRGHRAAFAGARPVAHAMLHVTDVCGPSRRARIGLIGNVYTDPAWRGRSLAAGCVEACVQEARARECSLALLWSELVDYYGKLGFGAVGRERRIALAGGTLACAAALAPRAEPAAAVGAAAAADFAHLEALYARKPVRAVRPPGALAKLARAPEVALRVARRGREPIAYAACGRGDDMRGVVHEWAGDASGVLACVASLQRDAGAHLMLASSQPEPAAERLVAAGARVEATALGLARVLDAGAAEASRLDDWLYLWGFDSI
jgi:predicted N-acetyltransferase YhbS